MFFDFLWILSGGEMSKCHSRGDRGFTLVEVMVSLLIFMVTSMGLLPLLITA
ncbi:MAG: prepilin-type N-terminal cleavage/methylation domain-containing protein, partial [Desulfuromonadales bacterium]|nr:prepilin-type N-terminal cleavage/methylation domain-containing protein [Desulfuromonadales bacterium]